MNETINAIYTRRSVRAFTEEKLPRETLETIADCARWAPSARGLQTWRFTVVSDRKRIRELSLTLGAALGRDAGYNFYSPDALILCSNERSSAFAIEDCACAMQTIFLAARSLGVGSVWINQFKGMCDVPSVRAALDGLGLPADHIVLGTAALGFPADPDAFKKTEKRAGTVHFAD